MKIPVCSENETYIVEDEIPDAKEEVVVKEPKLKNKI
jgi:hypothetical protein